MIAARPSKFTRLFAMPKTFVASLAGLATATALLLGTVAAQADQTAVLSQGNAVVTGFSGTAPAATPAASGDPNDALFIDLNGASARILNVQTGGQPAQGQIVPSPTVLPVKAGDVGQVFGIALDDGKGADGTQSGVPDIYLTATSAFGMQIVAPDASGQMQRLKAGAPGAQFMAGQLGDASKGATPGSIWKVSGTTGQVSLFANVVLNSQPNSGPGLGNIAFDPQSRQLFVSDLETGMIHRFSLGGQDLGYFDHGTQARVSQGLAPVPYDPSSRLDITNPAFSVNDATTWHYAQKGRMVWGLKVSAGRLYYATGDGPQVWSVSLGADGSFGTDAHLEIDVTGTTNGNAISDVTFDGPDTMYLAQRGTAQGDYTYKTFADPAKSDVLRYHRDPKTGKWTQTFEEYAVGFPPDNRNTNGGVAIDTCNSLVWTTGELLRQGSGLGGTEAVHGLQGMDKSLIRPANVPPKQSYFVEYNPQFEDAAAHGHIGDVEIFHPCQQTGQATTTTVQPVPLPVPQPLPPGPDLSLTKTADGPCVPVQGGAFECDFTVTVTEVGPVAFVGPIEITDTTSFSHGQLSTTSTPPFTCTGTASQTLVCDLPPSTLLPGQSVQLHVAETIAHGDISSASCQVPNSASITLAPGDVNPGNNTGFATATLPDPNCIPVPPPSNTPPDLTITKSSLGECAPAPGGAFVCKFTISVFNNGPGSVSGPIQVTDTTSFNHGQLASTTTPPWTCSGTASQTLVCQDTPPAPVPPGGGFDVLQVTETIAQADLNTAPCQVPNTATITGSADGDSNPANNTASATDPLPAGVQCVPVPPPVTQGGNLSIQKKGGDCTKTGVGFDCHFKVTVTNSGTVPFNGPITVNDTLGATLGIAPQFSGQFNCTPSANAVCTAPPQTLAPGASVSFDELVVVASTEVATTACKLPNTASIAVPAPGSPANLNAGDDTATAIGTINDPTCLQNPPPPAPQSNLKITKIGDPCTKNGANFVCNYVVTIANTSNVDLTNAPVTFNDNTTLGTLAASSPGWTCDNPTNNGNDDHTCSNPGVTIPANSSVAINMTVTVPGTAVNLCREDNTVHITSPNGGSAQNSDPSDDTASASDNLPNPNCNNPPPLQQSNLRLIKTAQPNCTPNPNNNGNFLCGFSLAVVNDGPAACCDQLGILDEEQAPGVNATFSNTLPGVTCIAVPGGNPPTVAAQCTSPNPVTLPIGTPVKVTDMVIEVPATTATPAGCKIDNLAGIFAPPGGSAANSNAADDISGATAKVPLAPDANGAVPCDPPGLKLRKVANPTLCAKSAAGFDCSFDISIDSIGPDPFHGPITINETIPAGATLKSNSPDWTCTGAAPAIQCSHKFMDIPKGQSTSFKVTVSVPDSTASSGTCFVPNKIAMSFTAGPLKGKTFTASAAAKIDDPRCNRTPPSTNNGHVSIQKKCDPSTVGAGIACSITLTNDGGQPIGTTISFTDKGQWTGNGTPMHVQSAKPDNPAVSCSGLPDAMSCSVPGSALPPGRSVTVAVVLASGGDQIRYKNCATLVSVNGSPLTGSGHESCVEGGGDISVVKTGPATCLWGQSCTFQVAIVNNSGAPFSGPVLLGDAMFLNGAPQSNLPISVAPAFGCPANPATLQFNCVAQVSLAGHEQQMHTVSVRMPAGDRTKSADGLNCFFATDGSKGLSGSANSPSALAASALHTGNGPGYSCVPFKVPAIQVLQQPQACPGDEVQIGTQCQCPPGTRPASNFRCITGGGTIIVPVPIPLPPAKRCQYPLVGDYPDCHCPRGTVFNGDRNTCDQPPSKQCQYPMVGDYPDCHCPRGTIYNPNRNSCDQPPVQPPKQCQYPLVGDYPDCHCPRGTVFNGDRNTCDQPPSKQCQYPMVGDYPNCHCPRGTIFNADRNTCDQPPSKQCQYPMVGDYPNCHCPEGTRYNKDRNTCDRPVQCTGGQVPNGNGGCACPADKPLYLNGTCTRPVVICTGGQVSNGNGGCVCPADKPNYADGVCTRPHVICRLPLVLQPDGSCGCPGGQTLQHGQCVSAKPVQYCPSGSSGNYPNCTCNSPRMTWNGSACVLKTNGGDNGNGQTCKGVIINGVCVTKLAPAPVACTAPAHGYLPNCTCPNGTPGNGSACTKVIKNNNPTGGNPQACANGMHWNGSSCVPNLKPSNGGVLKKLFPNLGGFNNGPVVK